MEEFSTSGARPPKRIRHNQGHFTDGPKMTADERDRRPARIPRKERCTKERPAAAFRQHLFVHPDAIERPYSRRQVELMCPYCGHSWREPR